MSQENVTRLQRSDEAFGDEATSPPSSRRWTPTWSGGIKPQAPGYPPAGVHRGPQAIANGVLLAPFLRITRSSRPFPRKPDAGDRVIVIGEYRGKGKASGTPFVAPFVHIHTFRNGKWVRFQEYTRYGHCRRSNQVSNRLSGFLVFIAEVRNSVVCCCRVLFG